LKITTSSEFAEMLARKLCREALWFGNSCTWIGLEASEKHGRRVIYARTLGPELYGGTSGIAYFLSDIFGATGDELFRTTAVGAMNFALGRCGRLTQRSEIGLHSGLSGIVMTSVICGFICRDQSIVDHSSKLVSHIEDVLLREECGNDIVSGLSGIILSFLTLWRASSTAKYLETAVFCGDKLINAAVTDSESSSWVPGKGSTQPLTGFAHGAGGIASSLLELFSITGDQKFLAVAQKAFAFEALHFNPSVNNWEDLRPTADQPPRKPRFGISWCHGAPGILLSRLRAYGITKSEKYKSEIMMAMRATIEIANHELRQSHSDTCLCHGLAGLAMILHDASTILDDSECLRVAEEIAWTVSGRWKRDGFLNSGLSIHSDTPQLMLGTAGVGECYLQIGHRSLLPSILHLGTALE
jgi:lantibiotic biosynthesis protein